MNIQTDTRLQERLNAALQKGDTTEIGLVIQQMNLYHVRQYAERLQKFAPYPWCLRPWMCVGKGYCPRDPNCGE